MYQALLTRRYLLRKVIPLLAMLSVAMCTAMVIIVLSVMGGFLEMAKAAGRTLVGDVAVEQRLTGLPYYEEMLTRIRNVPEVEAASPLIETYGLLKLPDGQVTPIQILGIEPESYDAVTGYGNTMVWRPLSPEEAVGVDPRDLRLPASEVYGLSPEEHERLMTQVEREGRRLRGRDGESGVVLGVEISPWNIRYKFGSYGVGRYWMPTEEVTISVLPITPEGALLEPESRRLPVLNEFFVGRYDVDSNVVFVPFDLLQELAKLQPKQEIDRSRPLLDENGEPVLDAFGEPQYETRPFPGRATKIVVRVRDDSTPQAVRDEVIAIYQALEDEHAGEMPSLNRRTVLTWEEQIAQFIGAVQKETALVTTLFSIISLVAVVLVLSIFWTIVQQKTRDIGILRSVGAARTGIMWLFLRYGLLLGVIGALLGGVLAFIIVRNINPIHEFIGRAFGVVIWDPRVYYFGEVPNEVNLTHALVIMFGGVVFAVVGALIPAVRAAYVDPVTALRYE